MTPEKSPVKPKNEPGSFRDPAGQIVYFENSPYRIIHSSFVENFLQVEATGLLTDLMKQKKLLAYEKVNAPFEIAPHSLVLKPEAIEFISYPYEWSFEALKKAALAQLDIHLLALKYDVTLSDATPYNMQFLGATPVFIDHLSFVPYQSGDIFWGYRQFCELYLAPLLLKHYLRLDFQKFLRAELGGICIKEINRLLPWYSKFNYKIFFHIFLQAKLQAKQSNSRKKLKKVVLPKKSLEQLLLSLQALINSLNSPLEKSVWSAYESSHSYSDTALSLKKQFIKQFCLRHKPKTVWDLGCNHTAFAEILLKHGVKSVIGLDADPQSVQQCFVNAEKKRLNFLPLLMDLANPSPSQGFRQQERKGFVERCNADAVFALALIHHLRISHNIPLEQLIEYVMKLAPAGVIEFVEKSDPMVKVLLQNRADIFLDYTFKNFKNIIRSKAHIIAEVKLTNMQRYLIHYECYTS